MIEASELWDRAVQLEEITISCHVHEISSFVEQDLARLYGNLFSSLPFFRIFKSMEDVSTYVVRQGGQAIVRHGQRGTDQWPLVRRYYQLSRRVRSGYVAVVNAHD